MNHPYLSRYVNIYMIVVRVGFWTCVEEDLLGDPLALLLLLPLENPRPLKLHTEREPCRNTPIHKKHT